jgi:hypothetical protein
MKLMQIHLAVEDIARSVHFYSAMFASRPTVIKSAAANACCVLAE